jgi:hypothetical protein
LSIFEKQIYTNTAPTEGGGCNKWGICCIFDAAVYVLN